MDRSSTLESGPSGQKPVSTIPSVTIRFAGDSGDGMQLAGTQFTDVSALVGNDVSTLPDFPAEIRAPAGTVAGVSGYQIQFASSDIFTPGDDIDALVAMNPASLKANLRLVKPGGLILANGDAFDAPGLKKAGYEKNPLEDGSLSGYRVVVVPMDTLNAEAVKPSGVTGKGIDRCKNFFALGLTYWLYDRPLQPTIAYLNEKFGKKYPEVAKANIATLEAGFHFGEITELLPIQYHIDRAKLPPGKYRRVTGNEAVALGLATAANLAGKQLFYGSYPITPATTILESLAAMKAFNVVTFQAEDEIAGIGSAIGASFAGSLGATGTSGPGMALKSEAMGLAVMMELPLVIVNVQRGGPSTGLPTKTEQADLFQAVFGRHGECPCPVIAATSPSDCFHAAVEASRIAIKYMTPVILLTDGYLANGAEPFLIPDVSRMEKIVVDHPSAANDPKGFMPYKRDENLVRPWALPGTPGLEHRLGGLEKADGGGAISYDPGNHEKMIHLRQEKVANVKPEGEPWLLSGKRQGKLLIVGWGGTYGSIKAATLDLQQMGKDVSCLQIRYMNPLPEGLGELLKAYDQVLVAELNLGQLAMFLRSQYLMDFKQLNKVRGLPFSVNDIVNAAIEVLEGKKAAKKEEVEEEVEAGGG
jgi:2-oxoglutarate ferredoxin oxidoreductase subunit alpha